MNLSFDREAGTRAPVWISAGLIAFCLSCLVLFVGWAQLSPLLVDGCSALTDGSGRCESGVNKIRIYALTLALFPLILLLERWRPADLHQQAFSPGLLVDAWWFLLFPVLGVAIPTFFEEFLHSNVGPALDGVKLHFFASLPVAAQVLLVVLVSDFLGWFSHWVRHKIPLLWEFHKIHHSQEQLNYFTSIRLHPLDLIANVAIRFLPFALLGMEMAVPSFIIWITFQRAWEMLVHSNLRMNLGWLRFILVTPQSHRIHHSLVPAHFDKNFGNIFPYWDMIFRTHVYDSECYPGTGIADPPARNEHARLLPAARACLQELAHPFVAMARMLKR